MATLLTSRGYKDRAKALEAVLENATDADLDTAIERFGAALTSEDRNFLKSLSSEELSSLNSTREKINYLGRSAEAANNNNNII